MKLTVYKTQNGWLVISGDHKYSFEDSVKESQSFDSLGKAVAHIRKIMKSWHTKLQTIDEHCGLPEGSFNSHVAKTQEQERHKSQADRLEKKGTM
jgi:hypothetical protein